MGQRHLLGAVNSSPTFLSSGRGECCARSHDLLWSLCDLCSRRAVDFSWEHTYVQQPGDLEKTPKRDIYLFLLFISIRIHCENKLSSQL